MFEDRNRERRLGKEAKALARKARKHGGELTGRDAARFAQVRGRQVKYQVRDTGDDDDDQYRRVENEQDW
jgi:hypothetical protein